jgi:8-oxo-dGTP pyrophosphatase MutT (NUDIX family)
MKHRIAAGVIVESNGRILLVQHRKPGAYDFWVAPGGGANASEDLHATARREVLEECGLHGEPRQLIYIEDLASLTLGSANSGSRVSWSAAPFAPTSDVARSVLEGP